MIIGTSLATPTWLPAAAPAPSVAGDAFVPSAASAPGVMPRPAAPSAARQTLGVLKSEGWTVQSTLHPKFHNPRAGMRRFDDISLDDAARLMATPQPEHLPKVVHLTSADGTHVDIFNTDELMALQYFRGVGSADGLEHRELAERLKDLADRGMTLQGTHKYWQPAPLGAYHSYNEGEPIKVVAGDFTVAELKDLDPDLAAAKPILDVLEQRVVPAVRSGLLEEAALGKVMESLARPLPAGSREEACDLFLAVAGARKQGTLEAVGLYETLVGIGLNTTACREALPTFLWLVERLDARDVKPAATYLLGLVPQRSVLPQAREERETTARHLVEGGTPAVQLGEATEQLVMRPPGEALEPRVQLYDDVRAMGGGLEDFETILRFRRPGQDVAEAGRPYLSMLSSMKGCGHERHAPSTYATLQDVSRLKGWTLDDTLSAFVGAYALRGNPWDALREIATREEPATAREAGRVERGQETVVIAGVSVPVRSGS